MKFRFRFLCHVAYRKKSCTLLCVFYLFLFSAAWRINEIIHAERNFRVRKFCPSVHPSVTLVHCIDRHGLAYHHTVFAIWHPLLQWLSTSTPRGGDTAAPAVCLRSCNCVPVCYYVFLCDKSITIVPRVTKFATHDDRDAL